MTGRRPPKRDTAMLVQDETADAIAGVGRPRHRQALVAAGRLKVAKVRREEATAARAAERVARLRHHATEGGDVKT